MVGLAILLALSMVLYEDYMQDEDPGILRWAIPVAAGLVTWNFLIGSLVLVLFFTVLDPAHNLVRGRKFFHSEKWALRDLIRGRCGIYDIVDGRIALMIEAFLLIVIISEILTK